MTLMHMLFVSISSLGVFKSWVETALQREQGTGQAHIQSGFQIWESQHYLY